MPRRLRQALLVILLTLITSLNGFTQSSTAQFNVADRGGFFASSASPGGGLTVGYSRIQTCCGGPLPAGAALFGFRANGILVSEASVPAVSLIRSGRTFVQIDGRVNTGIAIANPNSQSVTIDFVFTDATGNNVGQGSAVVGPNRQIAAFLNESPFNGRSSLQGTFTLSASALVGAIAIRGLVNERGEFLIATLPVADLATTFVATQMIPHFADGGGWTTELVLINPTESGIRGTLDWRTKGGGVAALTTASYSIPARSSIRLETSGVAAEIQTGSVRIVPDRVVNAPGSSQFTAPYAAALLTFKSRGVTLTQAGVTAEVPNSAFNIFVDTDGDTILTGIAIANSLATEAIVSLEVFDLNGNTTGRTGAISIPGNGQTAFFLSELSQFNALPRPFRGLLRATSGNSITVAGLRARYNERGDFIISTAVTVSDLFQRLSSELLFPHFAIGGGYQMGFILMSRRNESSAGTVYFFDQNGSALGLRFQ